MNRKQERENAFCLIFEKSLRNDTADEILELASEIRDFEVTDYITDTFTGVYSNNEEIDAEIIKYLDKWTLDRISKTSLAILRLAVYEILFAEDIPDSVAANEAVELSKVYCDEKDTAFINGVLGSLIKNK